MTAEIKKGKAVGKTAAPYSKSYAHRMLICAALADGVSEINGISDSDDISATLGCIEALGARYERCGDKVTVQPMPKAGELSPVLSCNESGSTLRFLIPVALALYGRADFKGTKKLISRGVGVYGELFSKKDIGIKISEDTVSVCGKLGGGYFEIPGNVSSQFASGLLLALPLLKENSTLVITPPVESRPYIDITVDVMSRFGVSVFEKSENRFEIVGGQKYVSSMQNVEGDWSNAAALYAFNLFGGCVEVDGLNFESIQGDRVCLSFFDELKEGMPTLDVSACPDLAPVLFACAAVQNGAIFTGTERLKIKESDRANVMASEMRKFGIAIDVSDNAVCVYPSKIHAPKETAESHNDHRIVMATALLMSAVGGKISGIEAIRKSFPDYFEKISSLGLEVIFGA